MKKSIIIATMALAALTGVTSCGDFLDKEPSNELTKEKTFSGWKTAQQFHWDTYNFLLHGALRVNNSWLDAATDLAECAIPTGGTRTSFNIGNYYGGGGAAEFTSVWESRYRGIRKCNMTLEMVDSVPKPVDETEELYQSERAQLISEARFFRAYFYWELFLRYGPVPIVKEVLDPNGDLLSAYTTRPSVREYISFILTELNECGEGMLSYEESTDASRAGRLNPAVPAALKSRILLYLASPRYASETGVTWQQAAEAAREFIETYGGNYGLYTKGDTNEQNYYYATVRTPYTGENNEIIFYRNDPTIGWGGIQNDTPIGEGGNGGNCPSQNLIDMYDMADGSSPFTNYDVTGAPVYNGVNPTVNEASGYTDASMWYNRDPRLAATVLYHGSLWNNRTIDVVAGHADNMTGNANATPTGYYMRKYIPETILASNHGGTAYRLWTIIRYAEILLNYAEALNEVEGPTQQVCDLLDQVRHRAGITGNVADRSDLKTKEAMRNFIHKERTVEFAFEEHRPWDVRRWNCAKEALSRPIYGINVAANGTITRKVAQQRVFEDRMYLYPIPEAEVWKANIENNPGW
ncbi:MAG: RagB/SusD family nutrient uptake outer membrane protein [Prevotella sp.]|nr:RagB/SusD family nutrient uptake outer membrane protein [Prevotella sp.]